ncbi:MAG: YdiU family protein [Crocinitomicaceae bacterium]
MTSFLDLEIVPQFSAELPADPDLSNTRRQVSNACFSLVDTKVPAHPTLVHASNQFMQELGIDLGVKADSLKVLSGAKPFPDFKAYAMCYGGHQFGHWAGQLGDGRAINIAELDINNQNWKFQLKGSGPTPYSRTADGLAVLRSSVREYLCSEAMHALGVPTTRALSLALTGDKVVRDMLYDGNPAEELGAVVCRVSPSFLRFGSFEIIAARQEKENLKTIVDYTINHHFRELGSPSKATYIAFFKSVVNKTRAMIVHWQRVGFVHGVMNTDNMSILGLTIDYGPYGWLEDFDLGWTPNTTDAQHKRYRFGNQPNIALWNLVQLANALYPLIEEAEPLQNILDEYKSGYLIDYNKMMCSKLGLQKAVEVTDDFITELVNLMQTSEIDMTLYFRLLASKASDTFAGFWKLLHEVTYLESEKLENSKDRWETWHKQYQDYISSENVSADNRFTQMNTVNPKYVLRNYMSQLAIDEANKGDFKLIDELYTMLLKPYDEQLQYQKWFAKRPDWAKYKVGCSQLSCSS